MKIKEKISIMTNIFINSGLDLKRNSMGNKT